MADLIKRLGLNRLLDRKPGTMSGGERQRAAIARALVINPALLLMDEPLAALDQHSRREILPCLQAVCRKLETPVIYVSHTLEEVIRLADHLVLIDSGREVAAGPIPEILTQLNLPLVHAANAATGIEAAVAGHDDEYGLTQLRFSGGQLTVPRADLAVGTGVRVRINASDVSLTLQRQQNTSILNIFPVSVDDLLPEDNAQYIVRLMAGTSPILARITRKSAASLGLKPGKKVYAQVKSVALS